MFDGVPYTTSCFPLEFQPRQFEYHSQLPLLGVGTCQGEVLVIDWEKNRVLDKAKFVGEERQLILALSWLRKDPKKILAASPIRAILYDVEPDSETPIKIRHNYGEVIEKLTSIHVNCTDSMMAASGYSKDVHVWDLHTGNIIRQYKDIHKDHINITRFANHLPDILLTCSFDKTVKMWDQRVNQQVPIFSVNSNAGNVMVCFSPNDQYFLISATDNEVKQYCLDGSLNLVYDLPTTGSNMNYTRSYYGGDGKTAVSGSSNSDQAFVCCTSTGKIINTVTIYEGRKGPDVYIQSLRTNPIAKKQFSVLAFYSYSEQYEIVTVDLSKNCDGKLLNDLNTSPSSVLELTNCFFTQIGKKNLSDVTLISCDHHVIYAHKVILKCWSWFRQHCCNGTSNERKIANESLPLGDKITQTPTGTIIVRFGTLSFALLKLILQYVYTSTCSVFEQEESDSFYFPPPPALPLLPLPPSREPSIRKKLHSSSSASSLSERGEEEELVEIEVPEEIKLDAYTEVEGEETAAEEEEDEDDTEDQKMRYAFGESDNDEGEEGEETFLDEDEEGFKNEEEEEEQDDELFWEDGAEKQVKISLQTAAKLYPLLKIYHLPRFAQLLLIFFSSKLWFSNVVDIFYFAHRYNIKKLIHTCECFMARNIECLPHLASRLPPEDYERVMLRANAKKTISRSLPRVPSGVCQSGNLLYCIGTYHVKGIEAVVMFNTQTHYWSLATCREASPPSMKSIQAAAIVVGKSPPNVNGSNSSSSGKTKKLVVFGGANESQIWILDLMTFTWSKPEILGKIPKARRRPSVTAARESIWLLGGRRGSFMLGGLYEYHVPTCTWNKPKVRGMKPEMRIGHTAVFVESMNSLVVIGGFSVHGATNAVYVLDLNSMVWTRPQDRDIEFLQQQPPNMHHQGIIFPLPRFYHLATLIKFGNKEYICIFGGMAEDQVNFLNDVWLLSLSDWRWTQMAVHGELKPPGNLAQCVFVIPPSPPAPPSLSSPSPNPTAATSACTTSACTTSACTTSACTTTACTTTACTTTACTTTACAATTATTSTSTTPTQSGHSNNSRSSVSSSSASNTFSHPKLGVWVATDHNAAPTSVFEFDFSTNLWSHLKTGVHGREPFPFLRVQTSSMLVDLRESFFDSLRESLNSGLNSFSLPPSSISPSPSSSSFAAVTKEENNTENVTIVVENKKISVSRFILCVRSEFFASLLQSSMVEKNAEILIEGISFSTVCAMLYFLYCGVLPPSETDNNNKHTIGDNSSSYYAHDHEGKTDELGSSLSFSPYFSPSPYLSGARSRTLSQNSNSSSFSSPTLTSFSIPPRSSYFGSTPSSPPFSKHHNYTSNPSTPLPSTPLPSPPVTSNLITLDYCLEPACFATTLQRSFSLFASCAEKCASIATTVTNNSVIIHTNTFAASELWADVDLDSSTHLVASILDLLVAGDRFRLDGLCAVIEATLSGMINCDNVCLLLHFAEFFSREKLRETSVTFVTVNFERVAKRPDYARISVCLRNRIEELYERWIEKGPELRSFGPAEIPPPITGG